MLAPSASAPGRALGEASSIHVWPHAGARPRREHDLAAEAVPRHRRDPAELAGERAQVRRRRVDRVRRRARLGPAVLPQIDEHHAPVGPPLDELARDPAPVAPRAVDPVRQQEPGRGRPPGGRDPFVVQAGGHAESMSCHGAPVEALAQLAAAGFDLAHAFDAAAAAREPGLSPLAGGGRLGILVGNTRALWPRFAAALAEPALAADPHPLQRYTEQAIDAAFPGARIFYGHRRYGGAFLPLQRLAVATGLGALAPSQLVVHPIYGPWFALRAAIVVEGDPPSARPPIPQPCRCGAACADALAAARTATGPDAWRAWLAVRDACPLRDHRYGEDQIRYHYTRAWPSRV